MSGRLGFALVGLGGLSTHQIAPAFARTRRCRLTAVVTGRAEEGAAWRARYGVSAYRYEDLARLADDPAVDVVYLVTPNAMRRDLALAVARAGKHVFCEKPLEVSSARCREMIDACAAAGVRLGVAYRQRFEPHHLECARLAREQVFGRVRMIRADFGFAIGQPPLWRLDQSLSGGGPLIDVGIYCLQTARMITGAEPVSVTAQAVRPAGGRFGDVEASIVFTLAFPDGVLAHCGASYEMPMNELAVYCERGAFGLKPAYNYGDNHGWRSDGEPLAFPQIDHFAAEMDDFARCIQTGEPSTVSGEEGLRDVAIIEELYRAALA